MADTSNLSKFLTDVANSIRTKKGTTEEIPAANFDTEIASIETGTKLPDGIFIQEETPTKTTDEAIWLKEQNTSSITFLDSIPDEILNDTYNETTIQYCLNALTNEQRNFINNTNHCILYYLSGWGLYIIGNDNFYISYDSYFESYDIMPRPYLFTASYNGTWSIQENYGGASFSNNVTWFTDKDVYNQAGTEIMIHKGVIDTESGLNVEINGIKYIVHTNKNNFFDKILDTSNGNITSADVLKDKVGYVNNTKIVGTYEPLDTSDATATINDIATDKTAYVNGEKITGTAEIVPDGIFIQEETPTKTTDEAIWLRIDNEKGIPFLDSLSDEVLSLTNSSGVTVRDLIDKLTDENKRLFNACSIHYIYIKGITIALYASNAAYIDTNNIILMKIPVYGFSYKYSFEDNSKLNGDGYYGTLTYSSDADIYCDTNIYNEEGNTLICKANLNIQEQNYLGATINGVTYNVAINRGSQFEKILDTFDADATANDIVSGKTAFVNNTKVIGTMPNNGELNIIPNTFDQTIPSGYITGGTVSGDENLTSENIKSGTSIFGVEGTLTSLDTSDATATANDIIQTKTAYVNGEKITGTYDPSVKLNIYCQGPDGDGTWNTKKMNELNSIPFDTYYSNPVLIGTDVYIFGGNGSPDYVKAYKYDTLTDTYTQLTNIPYAFGNGAATSVDTDVYLFGSNYHNETVATFAYKYDTLTDTYTQLTNIPFHFSNDVVAVGTDIYLIGSIGTSAAYKYDTLTDTYTQLKNTPTVFYETPVSVVGTDIYLFGSDYSESTLTKAYKYDTLTDTYTQLANIPYRPLAASVVSVGTNIYLFGGSHDAKKCYRYDTLTNSYTKLSDSSLNITRYGAAILNNMDIYIFGGMRSGNVNSIQVFSLNTGEPDPKQGLWLKSNVEYNSVITDTNVTLDPYWNTDKMSGLKPIPYQFSGSSATSVGTDVYLFGGGGVNSTIAYKYDTLTDTYTKIADIPITFGGLSYGAVASVGTDVYLFGGDSSDSSKTAAYKYDTLTNTYTQLTNIPYQFYRGGLAISVGTNIYLFGSQYSRTTYKYDTITNTYTALAEIPYRCEDGGITSIDTDIYIFGSSATDYNRNITAYKYDTLTDTYTQLANIPITFSYGSAVSVGTDIYLFNITDTYKYDTLTDAYAQLANIPYEFTRGGTISVKTDIYLFDDTKVQLFTFPVKNYADKSIVIQTTPKSKETNLITTDVVNGLPYGFDNFYYYTTTGGLDKTTEKYYGDGTQWNKI